MMYTYEQITSKGYEEVSKILIELCKDENTKNKMKSILYEGKIKDYLLPSHMSNKNSPIIEAKRRISMAYLLLNNPNTFEYFVDNDINLFHGTNASSLPSIIKYGLTSINKSEENGIEINTGEKTSRINGKRSFVSLTDVLDIAFGYSTLKPLKENELDFPALVVTSSTNIKTLSRINIQTDIPEIAIKDELPIQYIKAICVPTDKVNFFKKIVPEGIDVLTLDRVKDIFYYYEDEFANVEINYNALEKFKSNISNETKKRFSLKELKELAMNKTLEKIKNIGSDLKHAGRTY